MLGRNRSEPALFQMVGLEALVPPDDRLRKIDRVLDLSFVPEAVAECYTAGRGRPSVDPELAIRMMLLGALYGLADRELCEEVRLHVGFRWFCRLNLHDEVPDHSTLSKLKNERWAESGLFERLFDEVLRQCAVAGLVSGRHVSIDGTEVRANASMKSLSPLGPQPSAREQIGTLTVRPPLQGRRVIDGTLPPIGSRKPKLQVVLRVGGGIVPCHLIGGRRPPN